MIAALGRALVWLLDALVILAWLVVVACAAVAIWLLMAHAAEAACLTRAEARAKWPDSHIRWFTEGRCWGRSRIDLRDAEESHKNDRGRDGSERSGGDTPKAQDAPVSALERPAPGAKPAEIWFPAMQPGRGLEDRQPPLSWHQPWLSAESIIHWPLLLDVDRKPFVAWDRRIGQ